MKDIPDRLSYRNCRFFISGILKKIAYMAFFGIGPKKHNMGIENHLYRRMRNGNKRKN